MNPIDFKPLSDALSVVAKSMILAFNPLLDEFIEPADDTLSALNATIAASPLDRTALLVKADRLEELDKPMLAQLCRSRASQLELEAYIMDILIRSTGIPAHVFIGVKL